MNSHSNANRLLVNYISEYYKQKSQIWLKKLNCSQYLIKMETCLQNEEQLTTIFNVLRQQLFGFYV